MQLKALHTYLLPPLQYAISNLQWRILRHQKLVVHIRLAFFQRFLFAKLFIEKAGEKVEIVFLHCWSEMARFFDLAYQYFCAIWDVILFIFQNQMLTFVSNVEWFCIIFLVCWAKQQNVHISCLMWLQFRYVF